MNKLDEFLSSRHKLSEIVDLMVKGLEKEWVRVDFSTYGAIREDENDELLCFGCAATNTICEIKQVAFNTKVGSFDYIADRYSTTRNHIKLDQFEGAIDELRHGSGYIENAILELVDLCLLEYSEHYRSPSSVSSLLAAFPGELAYLNDFSYKEELGQYRDFVNYLKEKGL